MDNDLTRLVYPELLQVPPVAIEGVFKKQRIPPPIGRLGKDTSRLVVQIETKSGIPGSKIIT